MEVPARGRQFPEQAGVVHQPARDQVRDFALTFKRAENRQQLCAKQFATLLLDQARPDDHVVGHRSVKSTACPGKMFPLSEIAQAGDLPAFGSRAEMLPPQFVQAQGVSTE